MHLNYSRIQNRYTVSKTIYSKPNSLSSRKNLKNNIYETMNLFYIKYIKVDFKNSKSINGFWMTCINLIRNLILQINDIDQQWV